MPPNVPNEEILSQRLNRRCWYLTAGSWLAWLWLAGLVVCASAQVNKEYQIKAAFLYNFTKFVDWPAHRFADANSPFVIGVFGNNPFGDELAKVLKDRKINGRDFVIKTVNTADEALTTHLLFVGQAEKKRLPGLLPVLQKTGVLTVGECDPFVTQGGIINFLMEEDKIRFEINLNSAEQSGLKISAQLLKLAKVVHKKT